MCPDNYLDLVVFVSGSKVRVTIGFHAKMQRIAKTPCASAGRAGLAAAPVDAPHATARSANATNAHEARNTQPP